MGRLDLYGRRSVRTSPPANRFFLGELFVSAEDVVRELMLSAPSPPTPSSLIVETPQFSRGRIATRTSILQDREPYQAVLDAQWIDADDFECIVQQ